MPVHSVFGKSTNRSSRPAMNTAAISLVPPYSLAFFFGSESQACDVAVDGAGRFYRRFGNGGIADSQSDSSDKGGYRGENIRLVIRPINIDVVVIGDDIVPAGAERKH